MTVALPRFQQTNDAACGYASAAMVARKFRPTVDLDRLARALKTDESGTRQTAIERALRGLGITVSTHYDLDFAHLTAHLDRDHPIIVYRTDIDHWCVLCGYDRDPSRVYIADPLPGRPASYPWSEITRKLQRGFGMVCSDLRR
ncbi:MAG: C39 family peptidase [Deltaproteobacteria bacterium]|nr:C39 family peptidase [Deltaproteobacteria bacterium]